MIMNKGVHDKEETVEEKQILTAIPVESKPIFWNTTLRIDQPIKIEATDATVQLQMMPGHNLSSSRSLQAQIEKQYRTQLFCS